MIGGREAADFFEDTDAMNRKSGKENLKEGRFGYSEDLKRVQVNRKTDRRVWFYGARPFALPRRRGTKERDLRTPLLQI